MKSSASPQRSWSDGRGHSVSHADRKSTRLNSSHSQISYAVFCLKKNASWLGVADSADFHWGTGDFAVAMVVKLGYNSQEFRMWCKPGVGPNLTLASINFGDVSES